MPDPIQIRMGGYGPASTGFSRALKSIGDRLTAEFGRQPVADGFERAAEAGARGAVASHADLDRVGHRFLAKTSSRQAFASGRRLRHRDRDSGGGQAETERQ